MGYIVIEDWMVCELGLKGSRLIAYAAINGFSQGQQGKFTGSVGYLAEWAGVTRRAMQMTLRALEDDGLIERIEELSGSRAVQSWRVMPLPDGASEEGRKNFAGGEAGFAGCEKTSRGGAKKLRGGCEVFSPPKVCIELEDTLERKGEDARDAGEEKPSFASFAAEAIEKFNERFKTSYIDLYDAGCQLELGAAYNAGRTAADVDTVLANADEKWGSPEMRRNITPRVVFRHFSELLNYVPKSSPARPRARPRDAPLEAAPAVPDYVPEDYAAPDAATPEEIAAITARGMLMGGGR